MTYAPLNDEMFTAVYSAALGAMNASSRPYLAQDLAADFTALTQTAGAYAQRFDTVWGATATRLDIDLASFATEALFETIPPPTVEARLIPATYAPMVASVRQMVLQARSYYTAQGITPPPAGGVVPTGTGLAKVTAGSFDAAASLLVNADVNATAAIAGSKIAPSFGAQTVATTTAVAIGATVASAGALRLANTAAVLARNAADGGDLPVIKTDSSDFVEVGGTGVGGAIINVGAGYGGFVKSGNYKALYYQDKNQNADPIVGYLSPYGCHGTASIAAVSGSNTTILAADYIFETFRFTGSVAAVATMTVPAPASNGASYKRTIINDCTGSGYCLVTTGSGAVVRIPNGSAMIVSVDAAGVTSVAGQPSSLGVRLSTLGPAVSAGNTVGSATVGCRFGERYRRL